VRHASQEKEKKMNKNLFVVSSTLLILVLSMMVASIQVRAFPPWNGYVKPSFTDYAPSGMPDFDEKQDAWGPIVNHVFSGTYTWCVPTAVADILWWLDSKGESLFDPSAPVAPPTISDHFNLIVGSSTPPYQWDDHDPNNVWGLPPNLAYLMDTDGLRSHDGHGGTRWTDVQNGTLYYLKQQGVANYFTFDNSSFPSFAWIDNETYHGAGVVIGLAFWQLVGGVWNNNAVTEPGLTNGHCLAIAGTDNATNQLLVSDPWQNAYENNLVGGREPVLDPQPGNTSSHDDAQYVSQDAYTAAQYLGNPPPGYPPNPWELQGYLQTMPGYDASYHAFIMGAMALSLNPPQNIYTLNITVSPAGSGVVALNYTGPYSFGDVVNLTAYANAGYSFSSWSGSASGSANSTTITMTGNETVTATFAGIGTHDVAVTSVLPAKTVVGQGYGLNVTVTVANLGTYNETFNVTADLSSPSLGDARYLGSCPNLINGSSMNVTLVCNTTGMSYGNYTVSGHASIVPGETNTSNNDLTDGNITVTIPGDINGDLQVRLADLVLLANAYGTNSTNAQKIGTHLWNPNADIDNNGVVGLSDLVILATHYGRHYP
jgi:hypothetical protein